MSSTAPPRRFKVEPIETTVKSSKDTSHAQVENSKPRRRFAPEPVETTTKTNRKSSRDRFAEEWASQTSPIGRRFKPELIETRERSSRKQENATPNIVEPSTSTPKKASRPATRRFAPQLIETAKRTRKAGDSSPAVLPSDRTEATPEDDIRGSRRARILGTPTIPEDTPKANASQNPLFLEIKRQVSPLALRRSRPCSRGSTRSHHSFHVPDLDTIESSESEGSSPASPSTSPSIASDHSFMYKEATRMRESVDDRFSGYLLGLAAKAAERQLEEQAMAAFPNDDHHEPVDHFIGRDYDDGEYYIGQSKRRDETTFTEVNWELIAMRQHREQLEKKQENERERKRKQEAGMNRAETPSQNPWGNAAALLNSSANNNVIGYQKDPELDRMRKGARPPMLGDDIRFPRCSSPEPARFDPTQGSHALKSAICYLTEQSQASERGEGLWCGKNIPSNTPSLWSTPSSRPPSRGGLWGGCCKNTGLTPPRGPTGILTPRVEIDNPLETPAPTPARELLPPTPPPSNVDFACIDEKLEAQIAIEEEFGDDFVTQVYNYLSLGYPSVARMFDQELSKISHIDVSDLRHDDHLASSGGYIRLGEDGNLKAAEITEESCMRWRALRIYIREWARQQPGMASCDGAVGGIGTAVRRGSWAF